MAWPEATLFGVGYANEVVVVGFAAVLGERDLAAYRLLDILTTVLYTLIAAASTAVTVGLGNEFGAGQRPPVRRRVGAGIAVAAGLTAPVAGAALSAPGPLLGLATSDSAVAAAAAHALPWAILSMVPVVVTLCLAGALRAFGRNVWLMTASVLSDLVALVPVSWLLGVHWSLGLDGLYLGWLAFALVNLTLVAAWFSRVVRCADAARG